MLTKWQAPVITQDMRDNKQIFVDWLKHAIRIEGKMKAGRLARKAGIDPGTISKYLNGHSLPRDPADMIKICEVLEEDFEKIILDGRIEDGQLEKVEIKNTSTAIEPIPYDESIKEHINVVKKFKNKPMALDANKLLLEVESNDSFKFAELVTMMKKFASGTEFREIYKNEEEKTGDQAQGKPKLKNGTNDPV